MIQYPPRLLRRRTGATRRLLVWGEVHYEDEYGGQRTSWFCHNYIFFRGPNDNLQYRGFIHHTHNSSP